MIQDGMQAEDVVRMEAGKLIQDFSKNWGIIHGVLRGPDGKIKAVDWDLNQFQTLGKQHVADRLADVGETAMGWMAIGTGTGQGVGDNVLSTELASGRQAFDPTYPSHAANVVTYKRTFAAGEGTGTVTEAGIFNSATVGDMMLYDDGINFGKGAADSLALTWTFTVN
jgi:hypothetical protein